MFPVILNNSELCECGETPAAHSHDYTRVIITARPVCDLCSDRLTLAQYDAKLDSTGGGAWAYVCAAHFSLHNCELGLGQGQELVYYTDNNTTNN